MGLLITGTFGPLHPVYVYDTHTLILYDSGTYIRIYVTHKKGMQGRP